MNKRTEIAKYVIADYLASAITWTILWYFRKVYIESHKFGIPMSFQANGKFYLGLLLIPAFWIFLHTLAGLYVDVFKKSRVAELKQLFIVDVIGVIILFFAILLDDVVADYHNYYLSPSVLFGSQFILSSLGHLLITTGTNNKIHSRKIGFRTILVGSNQKANQLFDEMQAQRRSSGNDFIGFVHVDNNNGFSAELNQKLKHLGEFDAIRQTINQQRADEVIIAIESSEHKHIENIINTLNDCDVTVKIIPDMYDIITGSVKLSSIIDAPLIVVSHDILQPWQKFTKRFFDIGMSIFVLVLCSPIYLILALIIKSSSKGPIIYSQERIGLKGRPFTIFKFRSMYVDAEKDGPALSSEEDKRITRIGKFLRRTRLDEFPQFYNVLKGDMSVVGPRPERKFFIEQIVKITPSYRHLHRVKPGITSWGQVKYGYAENINQMIQRMKYDLLYIENMSFLLDIRIIIYTVLIIFQGRGK